MRSTCKPTPTTTYIFKRVTRADALICKALTNDKHSEIYLQLCTKLRSLENICIKERLKNGLLQNTFICKGQERKS